MAGCAQRLGDVVFPQEQRLSFQDIFYAFDSCEAGELDGRDLLRLLRHLLGHVTPQEAHWLHRHMVPDGRSKVSLEGFKMALREVSLVADELYVDHKLLIQAESLRVLNLLSAELLTNQVWHWLLVPQLTGPGTSSSVGQEDAIPCSKSRAWNRT